MKNLWDFIKRTWWLFVILFIAPICVIVVFAIKEYVVHDIDMSAGEWATLFSSVFSYWGTILLGTLAFWQNDRVMRLEERNMDIKERELKADNIPDFMIESARLFIYDEFLELDLQDLVSGMRQVKQCSLDIYEDIDIVQLDIFLKNTTNIRAFDVEVVESVLSENIENELYKIGVKKYEKIDGNEQLVLYYFIRLDEIKARNKVKHVEYSFDINYRNLYGYYFHNPMRVSVGHDKEELGLIIDIRLDEQKEGKKDVVVKGM